MITDINCQHLVAEERFGKSKCKANICSDYIIMNYTKKYMNEN